MNAAPHSPHMGLYIAPMAAASLRPRLTIALFVILITVILLAALPRPLSPDISGQLWIATNLRRGARLYIDISEINPPLWFWLAIPVDALATAVRVRAEDVLVAAIGGVTLLTLLATDRLLGRYPPGARAGLLAYAACILLVMPLRDLGQREQIVLIVALPYGALIAARRELQRVPVWLAIAIGLAAAIGFALKHYFVCVPLFLELWLAFSLRRAWRPFRPETLVLAACAAGYAAAIVIVTPGYLKVSVPELAIAYGAVGVPSLRYMLRPAQPIWALILFALDAQRRVARHPLSPQATALLVAAGGFFVAWLIQHKGWPYHSIATTGMLALALAAVLLEMVEATPARPRLMTVVALLAPLGLIAAPTQWAPAAENDIAPALTDLHPGDAVAIVSKEGRSVWPATVGRGFHFSARRGSYWILAAVDANSQGANNPQIVALGQSVVRETVLDFRCLPPQRIVFAPRHQPQRAMSASEDPLGYFLRDRHFAQLLSHYRRMDRPGNFDAYQLVQPFRPLPATACRRPT